MKASRMIIGTLKEAPQEAVIDSHILLIRSGMVKKEVAGLYNYMPMGYGHTYAIPTMQGGVETIKPYVDDFLLFAAAHSELDFLVTEIGCGIAGFTPREIAPLFLKAIENDIKNVYLPESFYKVYEQRM